MTQSVTNALDVAESAILAALNTLDPAGYAFWSGENPAGLTGQLNPTVTPHIERYYIAQHQDNGGQREQWLSREGWRGLVVTKCLSKSKDEAQVGYEAMVTAMQAIAHPTGYRLFVQFDRPISVPRDTAQVHTRAAQWIISIREFS